MGYGLQRRAGTILALTCAVILISLSSAAPIARAGYEAPSDGEKSQSEGKQAFVTRCGMCHGIDGHGGEHAPSIATGAAVQFSDADLERVLHNGIPSKGMPSFKDLNQAAVRSLIAYLRVVQGRDETAAVNGDSSRGKVLFFGAARCSDCHAIRGEGGFLGPDLSGYSRSHSPERIRRAILDPNRDIDANADTVTAITRDGQKLVGVARNEDNFSLQLQTLDGRFHLLTKSDLATLEHDHTSPMPSDYGSRLKARDLDDLISFLVSAGAESAGDTTVPSDTSESN